VLWALGQRTTEAGVITAVSKSGNTGLHRASAYGHVDAVRVLLSMGGVHSMLNAANESGETPLIRACRWGHRDVAWCLLANDADASVVDKSGRSAEDWGVEKGFSEVVDALASWRELGEAARERRVHEEKEKQADAILLVHTAIQSDAANASPIPDEDSDDRRGGRRAPGSTSAAAAAAGGGGGGGGGGGSGSGGPQVEAMRVEGWMAKQGHIIPNWKNRWFVLEGRHIRYYGRQGDSTPKGEIILENGTAVHVEPSARGARPNVFCVHTPKKKFNLQAADEEERDEWVNAINNNLKLIGPVPTASKFSDD
jgi:PH domain/Ankyrin repeats (3 copies)